MLYYLLSFCYKSTALNVVQVQRTYPYRIIILSYNEINEKTTWPDEPKANRTLE